MRNITEQIGRTMCTTTVPIKVVTSRSIVVLGSVLTASHVMTNKLTSATSSYNDQYGQNDYSLKMRRISHI